MYLRRCQLSLTSPQFSGFIYGLSGEFAKFTRHFGADAVTDYIEGLVETYPGLQYLDGFPEVIVAAGEFLFA